MGSLFSIDKKLNADANGDRQPFSVTKVLTIARPPFRETKIVWSTCFFRAKDGPRVGLTTNTSLEVYNLASGALHWSIPATLPELLRLHETGINFTVIMRASNDGTTLCATIEHKSGAKELVVIDAHEGRIITKRPLTHTNGDVPRFSNDNSRLAITDWTRRSDEPNHIRIIPIDAASNEKVRADGGNGPHPGYPYSEFLIPSLRPGSAMSMSFTPDGNQIITCEGPFLSAFASSPTPYAVTIRVYRCEDGTLINHIHHPGPPVPPSNPFFNSLQDLALRFHFPSSGEWLVSFPDYSENSNRTRVMDAKTGGTVALLSAERSIFQTLQSGILPPEGAELTFDEKSGVWTRLELKKTVLPAGQTATITRFVLAQPRPGARAAPTDVEVVVLGPFGQDDIVTIASSGSTLAVRRAEDHQIDVFRLGHW